MGGSSTLTENSAGVYTQPGIYGVQGQPSAANTPGGRAGASSWTDKDGNFWLFGGSISASTTYSGFLNDLWKYDSSTREWTWISGSSTIPVTSPNLGSISNYYGQPGVYGQKGKAASGNAPGARWGAQTWTDEDGNLWLFGGFGFDANDLNGILNDLWMFSPYTLQWTWLGGSSTLGADFEVAGNYGAQGSLTAGSYPGSRHDAVTWTAKDGSLWFLGGEGETTSGTGGIFTDLWKYVPSTNQWAWMGGSEASDIAGVYGQQGVPSRTNYPGSRMSSSGWVDQDGNFWLFGGQTWVDSNYSSSTTVVDDLWKYDPETNEWTWMGGTAADEFATYGIEGTPAPENRPSSRRSATAWTAKDGTFWLLGGIDLSPNALNDLWKFDPVLNEWAWMGGYSYSPVAGTVSGVYGKQGVPAATNLPTARQQGVSWVDATGVCWLFGGEGSDAKGVAGYLNDLWVLQPVAASPAFSLAAGTYTKEETLSISDTTSGSVIYYTTDGSAPTPSSTQYTGPITVASTETIKAIASASGYAYSAAASASYTINLPPAPTPVFTLAPGTYSSEQIVAMTDALRGSTIYFTTDGSKPTTASQLFTGARAVLETTTFKAIAVASGYSSSAVTTATYTIPALPPVVPTPVFTLAAGTYYSEQIVAMTDTLRTSTIHFTTDGSTPTASSQLFTGARAVSATTTFKAIAIATGYTNSAIVTAKYTIAPTLVAPAPVFTLAAGSYSGEQIVAMTDALRTSTIYFTTDGTTPTASSQVFTGARAVLATTTFKAIAIAPGYTNSAVATAEYVIQPATTP